MKLVVFTLIVIIIISLVCILIIFKQNKNNFNGKTQKVAVVTMTKKPIDFDIWIDHYLNKLNINSIFLRIEESPETENIIKKYNKKGNIYPIFVNEKIDNSNSYYVQMDRQKDFVNQTIEKCRKMGIEYLIHIDDDELFHINKNKFKNVQEFFESIHSQVTNSNLSNIHFQNFEAVFPENKKHCFDTNKFLDCKLGNCKSYCNGKSATNVSLNTQFFGPHNFSGMVLNVNPEDACVLHFDSACFEKWYQKFENLSHITSEEKFNNIPFAFYKNSIKLIKEGKNKDICKDFWTKMKVEPYYNESIPKLSIQRI